MPPPIRQPCILLLAAGGSRRLGRPKQLLLHRGKTLLEHAVAEAKASGAGPVITVTGTRNEGVLSLLDAAGVEHVVNEGWEEGMASSIRAGLRAIRGRHPHCDGVLVMACDQPLVHAGLLASLLEAQRAGATAAAASGYGGGAGIPAIFHHSLFEALEGLTGDRGAKGIIESDIRQVAVVPFPEGAIDIDTDKDHRDLLKGSEKEAT